MNQVLQLGSRGHYVAVLQADLKSAGYSTNDASGQFGSQTQQALEAFQRDFGLPVTGVTHPNTWQALLARLGVMSPPASNPEQARLLAQHPDMNRVLHLGSRGHVVATLQADLEEAGYHTGWWNGGVLGSKTEQALKAFQRDRGLPQSGITTPDTWQALLAKLDVVPPLGSKTDSKAPQPRAVEHTTHVPTAKTPHTKPSAPITTKQSTTGNQKSPNSAAKTIDGHPVIAVYHMVATAYGPSLKDNYPYGPTDYFGDPLKPGMIAVDPSVIPLKSRVYVTGYSDQQLPSGGFLGQAMDEGNAIKGHRIDIYMNAGPGAVSNFGFEPVTVYVLG